MKEYHNSIAKILRTIGIVYFALSLIGSYILGNMLEEIGLGSLLEMLLVGFVIYGLFTALIMGLAEIVELLHRQNENSKELINALKVINVSTPVANNKSESLFDDLPEL
mgnify:CR=1 FL=1